MAEKMIIEMTWERLAAMHDNGQSLYATPGAARPYWASNANFTYDECVATVWDFATRDGIEYSRDPDGWEGDEILVAEVELLAPRS
jgi:hypothetical protein